MQAQPQHCGRQRAHTGGRAFERDAPHFFSCERLQLVLRCTLLPIPPVRLYKAETFSFPCLQRFILYRERVKMCIHRDNPISSQLMCNIIDLYMRTQYVDELNV
ncbi:unnamed protein product [Ixodes persulcatus]